jgi:hypothetical protein
MFDVVVPVMVISEFILYLYFAALVVTEHQTIMDHLPYRKWQSFADAVPPQQSRFVARFALITLKNRGMNIVSPRHNLSLEERGRIDNVRAVCADGFTPWTANLFDVYKVVKQQEVNPNIWLQ